MAYTVSMEKSGFGNKKVVICNVSADAASGNFAPGLSAIDGYLMSPVSMNSGAPLIKVSGSSIVVSNATNGDNFFLFVYGR